MLKFLLPLFALFALSTPMSVAAVSGFDVSGLASSGTQGNQNQTDQMRTINQYQANRSAADYVGTTNNQTPISNGGLPPTYLGTIAPVFGCDGGDCSTGSGSGSSCDNPSAAGDCSTGYYGTYGNSDCIRSNGSCSSYAGGVTASLSSSCDQAFSSWASSGSCAPSSGSCGGTSIFTSGASGSACGLRADGSCPSSGATWTTCGAIPGCGGSSSCSPSSSSSSCSPCAPCPLTVGGR